jgi:hypothetical protein
MSEENAAALAENVQTQTQEQPAEQPAATQATEQPAAEQQPAEASAEHGPSEAETADTEGEARRRNNVPAKERIKQLTDRAKAAEAKSAALEAQLAQHKVEPAKDPLDYASDAEYNRAVIKEAVAEAEAKTIQRLAEQAQRERQDAVVEAWTAKTAAIKERAPDFDQVVYAQPEQGGPLIRPHMAEVIMNDDHGADVAYYLGKNPAEARRIAGLHPLVAAAEIGRISAKFAEQPAAKKVTSAPKPPTTLQGHGSPAEADPSRMSHEQYKAWRSKQ